MNIFLQTSYLCWLIIFGLCSIIVHLPVENAGKDETWLHFFTVTTFKGPEGDDFDLGTSTGPTTASVSNSVSTLYIDLRFINVFQMYFTNIIQRFFKCILMLFQDFSWSSWEPKVQVPYETEPGQVPRKIAIERLELKYTLSDAFVDVERKPPLMVSHWN